MKFFLGSFLIGVKSKVSGVLIGNIYFLMKGLFIGGIFYFCGGFDSSVSAVELYSAHGGTFLNNYANITGGHIDYRAAEVAELLCHSAEVLGIEYYDSFTNLVAEAAHSCAFDVLIALPKDLAYYAGKTLSAADGGQLFIYKGYMGETARDIYFQNYPSWAAESKYIVRPILSEGEIIKGLVQQIGNKYKIPIHSGRFLLDKEYLEFELQSLKEACSVGLYSCYLQKTVYAINLYTQELSTKFPYEEL